jgi:hypothetical protein
MQNAWARVSLHVLDPRLRVDRSESARPAATVTLGPGTAAGESGGSPGPAPGPGAAAATVA